MLWMYQRVFFGKVKHDINLKLPDLSVRERIALWPLAIAAVVMGVAPLLWINAVDPAVRNVLGTAAQVLSQVVAR